MKNIKKLVFFAMVFIMSIGFFQVINISNSNKNTNAAPVTPTVTYEKDVLSYMNINTNGQNLSSNNISINDTGVYVLANDSITINLKPFSVRYGYSTEESAYKDYYTNTKRIVIDTTSEDYEKSFEYNGKTYYFEILTRNITGSRPTEITTVRYMAFYENKPLQAAATTAIMTTLNTDIINYYENTDNITIEIVESFSLKTSDLIKSSNFEILVYKSAQASIPVTCKVTFLKSIVRFANAENPVVEFSTYKNRDPETTLYNYQETDNWLQKEQTFSKVDLSFLNSQYEYSEDNPLYFNINFNGFVYKYTMFSKDENLYVRYVDEIGEKENQLATSVDLSKIVTSHTNFSMIFTYRGRYFVEIYDSTYVFGFKTPNYYSTSFYVKDDSSDPSLLFDNIYVLAQTIDEESNPIDYIVNGATLNNNVTASVKNLSGFADGITISDIASRIDITYTEFGNSDNLPNTTRYYLKNEEEIDISQENNGKMVIVDRFYLQDFLRIMRENNDEFTNSFSSDGYYQIRIYNSSELYTNIDDADPVEYNFTIVKQAKTTYTIKGVIYQTDKPYYTDIRHYSQIINNSDPIRFHVALNKTQESVEQKLNISFQNDYSIIYGMQQVSLTFKVNEDAKTLVITCLGVGDMVVDVTFNNLTTTYNLNSEQNNSTISVTEYGTYTVSLKDSMGTSTVSSYKYAKKMNISTIILISLSAVVVLAVVIFIVSVRGKVKTR